MTTLNREQLHECAELLLPHILVVDERLPLLAEAVGFECPLLGQIEFDGAAWSFSVRLIEQLLVFGDIEPGMHALKALLYVVRERNGVDVRGRIDAFVAVVWGGGVGHGAQHLVPPPPERVLHFVGRLAELDDLQSKLAPGCLIALTGPGGIGKSALVAQVLWAMHDTDQLTSRFPDGMFYHAFYTQPLVDTALDRLVRAFGEAPEPNAFEAAQRLLAERRGLLVLDGAEAADDLERIVAVRGACGMLITSRRRSDAPDHATAVPTLPPDDAVALLRSWAGDVAIADGVAAAICQLVDGWPLALRFVGRYLGQTSESPDGYADWLEHGPYDALTPLRVSEQARQEHNAALLMQRSIAQVSEGAQGALALVGALAPAPFDRPLVAGALDQDDLGAGRALGELVDYGLLLRHGAAYTISHRLVHAFARARLAIAGDALERLADVTGARVGDIGTEVTGPGSPQRVDMTAHAMAVVSQGHARRAWPVALRLVERLFKRLAHVGHWRDAREAAQWALLSARGASDPRAEAIWLNRLGVGEFMTGALAEAIRSYADGLVLARASGDGECEAKLLTNLAWARRAQGDHEAALTNLDAAWRIAHRLGERQMEGRLLGDLGVWHHDQGDDAKAIRRHRTALAIARRIGDRQSEGVQLGNLGTIYSHQGDADPSAWPRASRKAIDHFTQALAIAREMGDGTNEVTWLGSLGEDYRRLGEFDPARDALEEGIRLARARGMLPTTGRQLLVLAKVRLAAGDAHAARLYATEALAILETFGQPSDAEKVRAFLAPLDG